MERNTAVMTKTIDWAAEVKKAWGQAWSEPDTAYQFSIREFKDSGSDGGVYVVPVFNALLLEDQRAGLDLNEILLEDGFRLGNG